jgi:hypothetical protein
VYAGFITSKRVVKRAGIHQRFDMSAYKMIEQYLPTDTFPTIKQILHFEGYNGPDGLNTKIGLKLKGLKENSHEDHNPSHMYDPATDTGEVPAQIAIHYDGLVAALRRGDMIRSAFEASWLAHFVGDGLTPAHHWPLDEKIAEAARKAAHDFTNGDTSKFTASLRKNWSIWGAKGEMSTHFNFEMGIAFALLLFPIRPEFSDEELTRALKLGPVEYFKSEARSVAELKLYEQFYKDGWNNSMATTVKNQLAPQAVRAIGTIWLLAMLEAGKQLVTQAEAQLASA